MMQPAEPGQFDHLATITRPQPDWSSEWGLLAQGMVRPVMMVVLEIQTKQPTQVYLIYYDEVIKELLTN